MTEIVPGILEQEWEAMKAKLDVVTSFAKTVHIDLLDGKFAENFTFRDPHPFTSYTKDTLFELHLMVEDPLQYVKPFAEAGFRRFLGHVEMMPDQTEFVAVTESLGEVGLVLDADTPLSAITVPFENLDSVLVMSVKAGFSGQVFLENSLHKIASLAKQHPMLTIEVDGGITDQTITKVYQAGARRFVATSALFSKDDPQEAYHHLSEIVAKEVESSVLPLENGNS